MTHSSDIQTQAPADRLAGSRKAFEQAKRLMPGGVNSPVRAYQAVGREPIVIRKGQGPRVFDVDGNAYIDYVGAFGPLILGHAHEAVVVAINKAAGGGFSFGMPTEAENALAQMVIDAVDAIERVRFVNSGTEACMSVIRLARAATGRAKIIKCIGCYHGHADSLLVQAGSGATTLGVPSSPGVPESITQHTLLAPYNDLDAIAALFAGHPGEIAVMGVEPIAGNMGCVAPADGYLQGLRKLCDQHGALLWFDEVMTGFRVAFGGAQARYDVKPDLTTLGKIVGGGLPCAAYGGRAELMNQVSPQGPVYQAGTLSGNPLAMAAGLTTLQTIRDAEPDLYDQLEQSAARLAQGLKQAAGDADVSVFVSRIGSMLTVFFSDQPVTNYAEATACDTAAFAVFFGALLDAGVVTPPSQFEAWFVSAAHDDQCIDHTIEAAREAFAAVKQSQA